MSQTTTPTPLRDRIAGAPISWGVCEVPGWGHQLGPDLVLEQMREVGLAATEFGPDGFLPDAPEAKARTLAAAGLRAVGGFVPVVLHDPASDPLPEVVLAMEALTTAQASTVVLAAATGAQGYDERPVLDDAQWATLLANLDRISDAAAERGLLATLHPHVGTMVETGDETDRVLDGSRIALCLDTGHLLIGGTDPVARRRRAPRPDRPRAPQGRARRPRRPGASAASSPTPRPCAQGMYVPLGAGDVDVAAIVRALEASGYTGWYVLEQDTILTGPRPTPASTRSPTCAPRSRTSWRSPTRWR